MKTLNALAIGLLCLCNTLPAAATQKKAIPPRRAKNPYAREVKVQNDCPFCRRTFTSVHELGRHMAVCAFVDALASDEFGNEE